MDSYIEASGVAVNKFIGGCHYRMKTGGLLLLLWLNQEYLGWDARKDALNLYDFYSIYPQRTQNFACRSPRL
jgi:hypothetical protein